MSKGLYLFILLVCCSIVTAIEYPVMTITDCASTIEVSVSGRLGIDPGEYSIIGCVENTTNVWMCSCSNSVSIIVDAAINTVNYYDLQINYVSYYYENVRSSGGSGGNRGYIPPKLVVINTTINTTNNTNTTITFPEITPPIEQPQQPIEQPIIPPIYRPPQNTTIEDNADKPGIFIRLWLWIKKILLYELW